MFPDMLAGTDDYVPDVSKQVEKLRRRMQKAEGTRAKNWGDRAEKSFEKLAYDEALLRLDKAIELDEGNSLLYSSRGAAHAAVQDWGGTLDDLDACIANLDPHRQGTISQDELVALENFKDLGETFYQVPSWLHGQLREYELREKDDEVAKMLEENALTYQRSAAEVSAATVGLGRHSCRDFCRDSDGWPLRRTAVARGEPAALAGGHGLRQVPGAEHLAGGARSVRE